MVLFDHPERPEQNKGGSNHEEALQHDDDSNVHARVHV